MARDRDPQCKQCRREGEKLFLKGERCLTDKCGIERRNYPPGEAGQNRRSKQSEYLLQLREKQKARRFYGVLEAQFRRYYDKANRQPGITGENLLRLLECRLAASIQADATLVGGQRFFQAHAAGFHLRDQGFQCLDRSLEIGDG